MQTTMILFIIDYYLFIFVLLSFIFFQVWYACSTETALSIDDAQV